MAQLIPFRALRPAPLVASRVASVPYDVVSTAEARALAQDEPLSFLHVTRSEIDLPDTTSPYDASVYDLVKAFQAKASVATAFQDKLLISYEQFHRQWLERYEQARS